MAVRSYDESLPSCVSQEKKVALCQLINGNLKAMAPSEEGRVEAECGSKSGVCLNWLKGVKTQSGDLSATDICAQC